MTPGTGASPRPAARQVLTLAAWLGIVGGLLEVALVYYRRAADGEFTGRPRDLLWLAPLTYALIYLLWAGLVLLVSGKWRRLSPIPVVGFGCGSAIVASLLTTHFGPRLHPAAVLLLGLGAGLQLARTLGRNGRLLPLVRQTTPWLLLALLLVAVGGVGSRAWRERRARAALPAAAAGAPNVLLLVLDTVRAASLSLYGHHRPTSPTMERVGEEGVVFDQALATAPWTLPSHASMFTGRWPHEQTTSWFRPMDKSDSTLAEALAGRGYATGGFVANLLYTDYEKGLGRGFQRYADFGFGLATMLNSCTLTRRLAGARSLRVLLGTDEMLTRKHGTDVNAEFLAWQAGLAGRPFFAFLNYFDAHDPYIPPPEWFRRIAGYERRDELSPLRRLGVLQRRDGMRPEEILYEQDAYEAAIAWLDAMVGELLTELERRGALENTIVVITSDHGEEFGEHGVFLHGHTLYRDAIHVPLVIRAPGRVPAGIRVAPPVSLRDLPATLLTLATAAPNKTFPGASLARFWSGGSLPAEPVLSEVQQAVRMPEWYPAARGTLRALTDTSHHFILNPAAPPQLFDWRADPEERVNLAGTPAGDSLVPRYEAPLRALPPFPSPSRKVEFP